MDAPSALLALVSRTVALRADVAQVVQAGQRVLRGLAIVHRLPPLEDVLGLGAGSVPHDSPGLDNLVTGHRRVGSAGG